MAIDNYRGQSTQTRQAAKEYIGQTKMSRNAFTSLRETFADIANRKSEAAKARRKGTPEGVEHSSEVYAQSCAKIAEHFAAYGFRYAKSGPHFTRRKNGFIQQVSFHTSYHNIPGKHVSLSVSANVRSNKLKKWRAIQEHSRRKDDYVAGGLIHLLGTDLTNVTWELADPKERESTISDVISFIGLVALSYFEFFDRPNDLIDCFQKQDFPAMDIADLVEFALCYGSKEKARMILDRYVAQRADLAADIEKAEVVFREEGYPIHFISKYADLVVFLKSAYGLRKGAQQGD